jgi:hypothetical protein
MAPDVDGHTRHVEVLDTGDSIGRKHRNPEFRNGGTHIAQTTRHAGVIQHRMAEGVQRIYLYPIVETAQEGTAAALGVRVGMQACRSKRAEYRLPGAIRSRERAQDRRIHGRHGLAETRAQSSGTVHQERKVETPASNTVAGLHHVAQAEVHVHGDHE